MRWPERFRGIGSDPDPAMVQAATGMGLAMDEVILSMPDPMVATPVDYDLTPLAELLGKMETYAGTL